MVSFDMIYFSFVSAQLQRKTGCRYVCECVHVVIGVCVLSLDEFMES